MWFVLTDIISINKNLLLEEALPLMRAGRVLKIDNTPTEICLTYYENKLSIALDSGKKEPIDTLLPDFRVYLLDKLFDVNTTLSEVRK